MPTTYYVFSTIERSINDLNAPTAQAIENAIRPLRLYRLEMVGPGPRIIRRAAVGSLRGFETYVTWVMRSPQGQGLEQTRNYGFQRAMNALSPIGRWDAVSIAPWSEAVNGSVGWWESGAATRTRTKESFPTMGGRVDAQENPIGPDARDIRPSTVTEAAPQLGAAVGQGLASVGSGAAVALLPVAAVVGGIAALIYFGPTILPAIVAKWRVAVHATKRKNPSGDGVGAIAALTGVGVGALGAYYLLHRERVQQIVSRGTEQLSPPNTDVNMTPEQKEREAIRLNALAARGEVN